MEVQKGLLVIIYVVKLANGYFEATSGFRFNKSVLVLNETKSFEKYGANNYRPKRQALEVDNNMHSCCTPLFFKRHIRRGNCFRVFSNNGEVQLRNFREELQYIVQGMQHFANGRPIHSFILHHQIDYIDISRRLTAAIQHHLGQRFKPPPADHMPDIPGNYWFVNLSPDALGDLNIVQIRGITWQNLHGHRNFNNYQSCRCGRVQITVGFYDNHPAANRFNINHFARQEDILEGVNCGN